MEETPKTNKIKTFIGIILLGLLGSGLWDFAFKDLCLIFGNFFANSMSIVYNGYLEDIYKGVGNNQNILKIFPSMIIIIGIICTPIFAIRKFSQILDKRDRMNHSQLPYIEKKTHFKDFILFLAKRRIRLYTFIILLTIPMSIIYIDLLIKEMSKNTAAIYIERDLEIIRPVINDATYYKLRSEFRLIDSKKGIEDIYIKIKFYAKTNKINLPEKSLIGIK